MLAGGFLPFSAIYLELFYIYESAWGHVMYSWHLLPFAAALVFIMTSASAMILTFFQLNNEDYRWWWQSFLVGGYVHAFHAPSRDSSFRHLLALIPLVLLYSRPRAPIVITHLVLLNYMFLWLACVHGLRAWPYIARRGGISCLAQSTVHLHIPLLVVVLSFPNAHGGSAAVCDVFLVRDHGVLLCVLIAGIGRFLLLPVVCALPV